MYTLLTVVVFSSLFCSRLGWVLPEAENAPTDLISTSLDLKRAVKAVGSCLGLITEDLWLKDSCSPIRRRSPLSNSRHDYLMHEARGDTNWRINSGLKRHNEHPPLFLFLLQRADFTKLMKTLFLKDLVFSVSLCDLGLASRPKPSWRNRISALRTYLHCSSRTTETLLCNTCNRWTDLKNAYSGDSYTSTGFNISGQQPSPSNPLGNPVLGQGTSANGLNWVGYIAAAYNSSLLLAYDLAVYGAAIDNNIVSAVPHDLVHQVEIDLRKQYCKTSEDHQEWDSRDTLFAIWIGINECVFLSVWPLSISHPLIPIAWQHRALLRKGWYRWDIELSFPATFATGWDYVQLWSTSVLTD